MQHEANSSGGGTARVTDDFEQLELPGVDPVTVMTVREAAHLVGVSLSWMYRLVLYRGIPRRKLSGRYHVDRARVEALPPPRER